MTSLASIAVLDASSAGVVADVESFGDTLKLNMKADISFVKRCDRCLDEYNEDVYLEIERMITTKADTEDLYDIVLENGSLNLEEVIVDELLIELPCSSLCGENCKGLCTDCGCNLNKESCSCSKEKIDPRWKSLQDLLKN